MRHVNVAHQQVMTADARVIAAKTCASMQRTALANNIVRAYFQPGFFTQKLLVRGIFSHGCELIDLVVAANFCIGLDDNVRRYLGALADFDAGANNAPRANSHTRS